MASKKITNNINQVKEIEMVEKDKVRKRTKKKQWVPTREEFQRMAIKHDTLLQFAREHADDPTGILSALYHDIIEKYCNLRMELRALKMDNAEQKRMNGILKQALERNTTHSQDCDKW